MTAPARTREEAEQQMVLYQKCLYEAGFAREADTMSVVYFEEGWGVRVPFSIRLSADAQRPFWQACHRATKLIGLPIVCFECYLTGSGEPHSAETCTYEGLCETL